MPLLIDLYCGAGGASVGYARAGFDVLGVDIEKHPDYPFDLIVCDALEFLREDQHWRADVVAASPPCQAHTTMSNRHRGQGGKADSHIDFITPTRFHLKRWGGPYVIENVRGARSLMVNPIVLSGGMFGLGTDRPRLFESNVPLTTPPQGRVENPLGVYGKLDGRRLWTRKDGSELRAPRTLRQGAEAMGIDWMTEWEDLTEAIPPAYTEWIGRQLLEAIK